MPARPWYPWNPGDYGRKTRHFTLEQDGAYRRLLDFAWDHDGLLPGDVRQIAQILGVHTNKAKTLWGFLRPFWFETQGGFRNKRIEKDLAHALDLSEKATAAARKRWDADAYANGYARSMQTTSRSPESNSEDRRKRVSERGRGSGGRGTRSARGTRLPDDWKIPSDWETWARENGNGLDVDLEAAKFRDHWVAKSGAQATKCDWQATWRNWIREAVRRAHGQGERSRGRPLSAVERVEQANAHLLGPRGRTLEGEVDD